MKKTFVLLLVLLLALSLFVGCDARNGKVMNSPDVGVTPVPTPGRTPTVTDVPAPTATHAPEETPGSGPAHTDEPADTAPPAPNNAAAYSF